MRTLREFRFVNATLLCICLLIIAYIITGYFSYQIVITGICSFIVGLLWLTLIITDKKSKYYMRIKDSSLIEFVRIIIHRESKENNCDYTLNRETLDIKPVDIHLIRKESCEHNYVKYNNIIYQCSKCNDKIFKKEGE